MEDFYCLTVCRKSLVDSDIPLLEKMLSAYLGVGSDIFNKAFDNTDKLSFELLLSIDALQECLLLLEEQGFVISASRVLNPKAISANVVAEPAYEKAHSLAQLTYDDCHALFYGNSNPINKWARHKNWIVFGCSFSVISAYLLMIYSSF